MNLTLPRVDPKDFAAAGQLLQDGIGETNRVLLAPALAAFQATIESALNRLDEVAPGIASAIRTSMEGLPAIAGASTDKVLDEFDGLTITVTCVISRRKNETR